MRLISLPEARRIANDPIELDRLKDEALKFKRDLNQIYRVDTLGFESDKFLASHPRWWEAYGKIVPGGARHGRSPQTEAFERWWEAELTTRRFDWAANGFFPTDMLGHELWVGDWVVWPVSWASSSQLRFGKLTTVLPNGSIQARTHDPKTLQPNKDDRISTISANIEFITKVTKP